MGSPEGALIKFFLSVTVSCAFLLFLVTDLFGGPAHGTATQETTRTHELLGLQLSKEQIQSGSLEGHISGGFLSTVGYVQGSFDGRKMVTLSTASSRVMMCDFVMTWPLENLQRLRFSPPRHVRPPTRIFSSTLNCVVRRAVSRVSGMTLLLQGKRDTAVHCLQRNAVGMLMRSPRAGTWTMRIW